MLTVTEFERVKKGQLKPAPIERSSEIVVSEKTAHSRASFRGLSSFFESRSRRCNELQVRERCQFSNRLQLFFSLAPPIKRLIASFCQTNRTLVRYSPPCITARRVAASSSKFRAATEADAAGVVFLMFSSENHPGLAISGGFAISS